MRYTRVFAVQTIISKLVLKHRPLLYLEKMPSVSKHASDGIFLSGGLLSDPFEYQVPNAVSEAFAARFEFGFGAVVRGGGVVCCRIFKAVEAAEDFKHLLRIFFPVCRQVDIAAGFEFGQQFGDEGGLYQTAFVVAFFVPRVGEEYMDAVERAVLQHIFDNFYGIVPHHADVFQMVFVNEFEQVAYAGTVYVDGEKVGFGQAAGDFCGCRPHTEAYFEDFGSVASETGIKIGRCCLVVDAEAVP